MPVNFTPSKADRIQISGTNADVIRETLSRFYEDLRGAPVKQIQIIGDHGSLDRSAPLVVLNLENLEIIRQSAEYLGDVSWYCMHEPKFTVALLMEGFRGAYVRRRHYDSEIVYCRGATEECYRVSPGRLLNSELVAAVCAAREAGVAAEVVREALQTATAPRLRTQDRALPPVSAIF